MFSKIFCCKNYNYGKQFIETIILADNNTFNK